MTTKPNTIKIDDVEYVRKGTSTILPTLNNFWLVRTFSAGVFAGNLVGRDGKPWDGGKIGIVKNAIRIFQWAGACSLSQLATEGTKTPAECKFSVAVPEEHLTEIIEAIPCTLPAYESITGVPTWKK